MKSWTDRNHEKITFVKCLQSSHSQKIFFLSFFLIKMILISHSRTNDIIQNWWKKIILIILFIMISNVWNHDGLYWLYTNSITQIDNEQIEIDDKLT